MAANNDPYCGNCNYSLVGLTESSKCPECGKPLIEVLQRPDTATPRGKRYQSRTRVFGLPLICIAIGPHGKELRGKAKGIIAIGDIAQGVLAIGGLAYGVIALGGMAIGVCTLGGMSIGLLAFGGAAIGGMVCGGGAIGLIALGGGAVGLVAVGGGAYGYYAMGGGAAGVHVINNLGGDPVARQFFDQWDWLLGQGPGTPVSMIRYVGRMMVGYLLIGMSSALAVLIGHRLGRGSEKKADGF